MTRAVELTRFDLPGGGVLDLKDGLKMVLAPRLRVWRTGDGDVVMEFQDVVGETVTVLVEEP